jgi:hypothetical protein
LEAHSAKLLALKSIGSSCSNPSSGGNLEALAEETKQEHSQAQTYQSGGILKASAFLPEDYSLNTWNSPTKATASVSANLLNLRQYDSAFRAYLLNHLSE